MAAPTILMPNAYTFYSDCSTYLVLVHFKPMVCFKADKPGELIAPSIHHTITRDTTTETQTATNKYHLAHEQTQRR